MFAPGPPARGVLAGGESMTFLDVYVIVILPLMVLGWALLLYWWAGREARRACSDEHARVPGSPPAHGHLLERIRIDAAVCGGTPCIRGSRISVACVLDLLAGGLSEADVRAAHPPLTREDVLAALAYGADAARVRVVSDSLPLRAD